VRADLNKAPATAIAIATYIVMGGFFTQSGVILTAAASYFHAPIPQTATLFSYLTGGNLAGLIVCLFIFNVFSIRRVLVCAYLTLFAGVALLAVSHALPIGALAIGLCGFGAGVGLSSGAVIIAKTYALRSRAVAFLGTDCTFSLSGYVFPAFAANAIALGWIWQSGYLAVAAVAAALLVAAAFVRFPVTGRTVPAGPAPAPRIASSRASRFAIALFALGLGLYLCGQGAFLIWAPQDLQTTFGLSAALAAPVVGAFWGPSIFGLVTAALLVTRIPPRAVVIGAAMATIGSLLACTLAPNAHAFFVATFAFGFASTCLFKLMISIGSEQIADAPPQLVTFLLLSASVGGTIAPAASAWIVNLRGPHAGIVMALACYAAMLAATLAALAVERWFRSGRGARSSSFR
jgi:MFS transporter, TsgA protein